MSKQKQPKRVAGELSHRAEAMTIDDLLAVIDPQSVHVRWTVDRSRAHVAFDILMDGITAPFLAGIFSVVSEIQPPRYVWLREDVEDFPTTIWDLIGAVDPRSWVVRSPVKRSRTEVSFEVPMNGNAVFITGAFVSISDANIRGRHGVMTVRDEGVWTFH